MDTQAKCCSRMFSLRSSWCGLAQATKMWASPNIRGVGAPLWGALYERVVFGMYIGVPSVLLVVAPRRIHLILPKVGNYTIPIRNG